MKVLIIGYGSIGKRHFEILSGLEEVNQIDLVTKQPISHVIKYNELSVIPSEALLEYDYFVIASRTCDHYEQLEYLCKHVDSKKILVEKPLYDISYSSTAVESNTVCVAYNLRFHPVLLKLRELLSVYKPLLVNVVCGQYLPDWRPGTDYRGSYSAKSHQGGGVLRDLSHELDYCTWLFGTFDKVSSVSKKLSSLDISSDDVFSCLGITKSNIVMSISLDYLSRQPLRQLIIQCDNATIFVNLIDGKIQLIGHNRNESFNYDVKRNDTYLAMHKYFIGNNFERLCSYSNGIEIVEFIDQNLMDGVSL